MLPASVRPVAAGAAPAYDLGLVEPQALQRELHGWVILDARPKERWREGHLPGALSFSWEDYTRTDGRGIPYRIWPPAELAAALGRMGIDERTPVAVYGDADSSWGGEGWACWALTWLGHRGPVRLLAGGVQAWHELGLPLTTDPDGARPPRSYAFRLRPEVDVAAEEVAWLGEGAVLVDTRSTLEWLTGSLPGAVHLPWKELFTGPDRRPISPAALRRLLREKGVEDGRPVVYYCTGGIRSGYVWLVHQLAGLPAARNFEGGMAAWERR